MAKNHGKRLLMELSEVAQRKASAADPAAWEKGLVTIDEATFKEVYNGYIQGIMTGRIKLSEETEGSPPHPSHEEGGAHEARKPRLLLCYICGTLHGKRSALVAHHEECKENFMERQKDVDKHMRMKMPRPPTQKVPGKSASATEVLTCY